MEKQNYMMTASDVANELGVSIGNAYKLVGNLNKELERSGYLVVAGKIPRAYWETKIYGFSHYQKGE